MNRQSGFTLIELVIVIVLLGVLAAIAVPRFVNLEDDAQAASLESTAAALSSAMSINYAGCALNGHDPAHVDCDTVNSCADASTVVNGGSLGDFQVVADTAVGTNNGDTGTCQVRRGASGTPANFTAIRAGT